LPQVPQLRGSLNVLTQAPEHAVSPPVHVVQPPEMQTVPAPHVVVQLPQCIESFDVSTQAPLQSVRPAEHPTTQLLAVHVMPVVQTIVQLPQ